MSVDSGGSAGLWFIVSVVVAWLVIYTAVRAAVGHALDRDEPRLLAEATASQNGVSFAVTNIGMRPAFDLRVRWHDTPTGEALAHTPMLGANGRLEWSLDVGAVAGETQIVRSLDLNWASGLPAESNRRSAARAVLIPSRLAPPA